MTERIKALEKQGQYLIKHAPAGFWNWNWNGMLGTFRVERGSFTENFDLTINGTIQDPSAEGKMFDIQGLKVPAAGWESYQKFTVHVLTPYLSTYAQQRRWTNNE